MHGLYTSRQGCCTGDKKRTLKLVTVTVQRQLWIHENTRVPESATRGELGVSEPDQFGLAPLTNIIEYHQNNKGKLLNDL